MAVLVAVLVSAVAWTAVDGAVPRGVLIGVLVAFGSVPTVGGEFAAVRAGLAVGVLPPMGVSAGVAVLVAVGGTTAVEVGTDKGVVIGTTRTVGVRQVVTDVVAAGAGVAVSVAAGTAVNVAAVEVSDRLAIDSVGVGVGTGVSVGV